MACFESNRIATVAALLAGLFSFNTVHAPTQSPDALCTVLFTAAIVTFTHGRPHRDRRLLALAGILLGVAAQFRPNMILMRSCWPHI
jgi:4-amino-4-deoxy-L-arabinose transferase-like glycosyltransferase